MHDIDFHNHRDPEALKAKADQNYFELLHFTKHPLCFEFRAKEFLFSLQSIHSLIYYKQSHRRWSQGLIFHQALVDCARAGILLPLGG